MPALPWWDSHKQSFVYERILGLPGGKHIFECMQCGTCGGACPVSFAMDRTPRQIINLVRDGRVEEALGSETIWLCASCYNCTTHCPAGIQITDVMYTLKVASTELGIHHKNTLGPLFAKAMVKQLETKGRVAEIRLILGVSRHKLSLLTTLSPLIYLKLLRAGRVHLRSRKIEHVDQLKKMNGWLIASDFSLEEKNRV
jgi:heterodisulfide reductase subunit C